MTSARPFLTAEWRFIMMLNYVVDPAVLSPLLPAGTELDLWEGQALASVVGFLFDRTRLFGIPVPFHTRFEEINLRFYVRRPVGGETRRGVTFVKEIVPKVMIARTARWFYGENYVAMPTRRTIEQQNGKLCPEGLVEYTWRHRGRLNRIGGLALADAEPLQPGSEAEFIFEHYWGYTRLSPKKTGEYRVDHPAWKVWRVAQPYLLCNIKDIYGPAFETFLRRRPRSAFLAEGSQVAVYGGKKFNAR